MPREAGSRKRRGRKGTSPSAKVQLLLPKSEPRPTFGESRKAAGVFQPGAASPFRAISEADNRKEAVLCIKQSLRPRHRLEKDGDHLPVGGRQVQGLQVASGPSMEHAGRRR